MIHDVIMFWRKNCEACYIEPNNPFKIIYISQFYAKKIVKFKNFPFCIIND